MQLYDGKSCSDVAVKDNKCFWHSDVRKTDENVRRFFPAYSSIKALIEQERPSLERADLTCDDLSGIDFHELNLRGAFFDKADLRGSIFVRANLTSAYLNEANLENADLTEANLTKAAMARSNLKYARLDRALLQNTRLLESNLSFASLREVVLRSTKLHFVNLYQADLALAKFSNREAQLKFCNTDEPVFEDFFEKRLVAWIKYGQKVLALQVIEFFQKKLAPERLQAWIKRIQLALEEKFRTAQREQNMEEIADIFEFLSRLYKITGSLPRTLALPAPQRTIPPRDGEEILRVTSTLLDDRIELADFIRLTQSLSNVLATATEVVLAENTLAFRIAPTLISLSLQSPLEIFLAVSAGLPAAILKFISWYQEFILKNQEIHKAELEVERTRLEIEQQKLELDKQKLSAQVQWLDLKEKIRREHAAAKEEEVDDLIVQMHQHIAFVRQSNIFKDYGISTAKEQQLIKTVAREIDSSHSQLELDINNDSSIL